MYEFSSNPPIFRHAQHSLVNPEEFSNAVSGIELSLDFLGRHALPTQVEQFQSPAWAMDFGEAHVKACVRGSVSSGWASFCFVLAGSSHWRGISGNAGGLLCAPPGEELDGKIAPGFTWVTLAMPPQLWQRYQLVAGAQEGHLQQLKGWALPAAMSAQFTSRMRQAQWQLKLAGAQPELGGLAVETARSLTADIAVSVWELAAQAQRRITQSDRTRLARRAQVWILDRLSEPIRVPDVCLALHVSRRELEYAFRATFDQSPRDYLEALRLNAVRRALLGLKGEKETVSRIAVEHGINHFGRFSAQYQRLFGEMPSVTLRKT